ncbi:hypothetical protein BKA62DRAFT_832645 [Auriculariales sp. MPI-PUGE-AT-0066]|nr:hypothetical protein BKA62DRAFT_832645 [Auriculariales sp. MPI-PUGE-AT-0066]
MKRLRPKLRGSSHNYKHLGSIVFASHLLLLLAMRSSPPSSFRSPPPVANNLSFLNSWNGTEISPSGRRPDQPASSSSQTTFFSLPPASSALTIDLAKANTFTASLVEEIGLVSLPLSPKRFAMAQQDTFDMLEQASSSSPLRASRRKPRHTTECREGASRTASHREVAQICHAARVRVPIARAEYRPAPIKRSSSAVDMRTDRGFFFAGDGASKVKTQVSQRASIPSLSANPDRPTTPPNRLKHAFSLSRLRSSLSIRHTVSKPEFTFAQRTL